MTSKSTAKWLHQKTKCIASDGHTQSETQVFVVVSQHDEFTASFANSVFSRVSKRITYAFGAIIFINVSLVEFRNASCARPTMNFESRFMHFCTVSLAASFMIPTTCVKQQAHEDPRVEGVHSRNCGSTHKAPNKVRLT